MAVRLRSFAGAAAPTASPADAADRPSPRRRDWLAPTRSARVRIVFSYIVLLVLSTVVLTLVLRQILLIRVDDEIQAALQQETLELDRLLADGRDPETGQPFTSLRTVFDVYFARNVPSDDEAVLAFWNGELYASNLTRFPLEQLPAAAVEDWKAFSSRLPATEAGINGRFPTELGEAHFQASRLWFGGNPGAFVVAILPLTQTAVIGEVQTFGILASIAVLLLASLSAWLIVGRALSPVRMLTDTARSISQSDLTRRIEVRGTDEAAEMARSFNAMLDRLETVFRSQREFTEDASHELRDPLTVSRGHLELLSEDQAERDRTVELVIDELDRMARIVDDLQLLADAQQPDFLRLEPVDLGVFGQELIDKVQPLGPQTWVLEPGNGVILADRHRLTEAVMNLASNAVQHTKAEDTITLGVGADADSAWLRVEDTGVGISLSDQGRVFGRFNRGHGAGRRYRGSGLGLAIVRAIAEAHGGRVVLESRLGVGSTFTIQLPRGEQASEAAWPES